MTRFIVCRSSTEFLPRTGPDMHAHDFWQIDWVQSGRAVIVCGIEHEIPEGHIAVVAPGIVHGYRFPVRGMMSVLKFTPHFRFAIPGGFLCRALTSDMETLLANTIDEYHTSHRHRLQISSNFMEIFLYKHIIMETREKDPLMDAAAEYMSANRSASLTDSILAETHGLSVNHFIKRFQRYFGTTPAQHLRSIRIEASKEELLFRERPMLDIARSAGYADVASFSKVFKLTGMPPAKYRELSV